MFGIEMNAVFMHNKTVFKKVVFNPVNQDKTVLLYWLDREIYKPLEDSSWKDVEKGVARL